MNQKKDFIIRMYEIITLRYLYICFWHSNGTHEIIRMKETIVTIIHLCVYTNVRY